MQFGEGELRGQEARRQVRIRPLAAQAMYREFGFAPAGVRKGYYIESNEDAIVMWAHDVDLPAYTQRLDEIERTVPGTTVVDAVE